LGEDLISFLCLGVKSRALVLNALAENLDALKCGGWGVFISPATKMVVGEAVCRWAHQTVRCASHVTQPLGFDRWSSDRWGHRTGTVHCPVRLLAPALTLRELSAHCSVVSRPLNSTVALATVVPLAHRTVQCYIGQSGEL
jgi:hypothetical protein